MITERRKTKVFHRCINRLKSSDSVLPSLMAKGGYFVDYLKKNQDTVIADVPLPESIKEVDIEQYESDMYNTMLAYLKRETESFEVPAVEKEISAMSRILEALESFMVEVTKGKADYRHRRYNGFAGCGLIVSSNPNDLKMEKEGDVVLLAVDPKPIVFLMDSLRVICGDYITYLNKHEFFHGIAKRASNHLDSCDEMLDETKFFFEGIKHAADLVERHASYLSRLLAEFYSFWDEE
jgi:hypothetical protein